MGGKTGDPKAGDDFQDEETGGITDCVAGGIAHIAVSSSGQSSYVHPRVLPAGQSFSHQTSASTEVDRSKGSHPDP